MGDQKFTDYYNILRVNPKCDRKSLESAYHSLLKMYHPDHTGAADTTKFNRLVEAYRVLRDPAKRAEYDIEYVRYIGEEAPQTTTGNGTEVGEKTALDDADDHAKLLMFLYKKRREDAQNAGVAGYYLQEMLNCSDEHFEFHKWYLKEKGFILVTEQGTLAITIHGIDHVISISRTTRAEKLLIGQSRSPEDSS